MSDSNSEKATQQTCTCVNPPAKKRRRRRRNFRYCRESSLIDLHSVLQENLTQLPHLLEYLFPEDTDKTSSSPGQDSSHRNTENDEDSNCPDEDIPVNCPIRTRDEDLVPIHGVFYFHIRSKINLGKKILAKVEARTILDTQILHYARACKVALLNYSIQDDHFHMLIAVKTDSYAVARGKASKMVGCIKQQFTRRFKLWYNEFHVRERKYRIKPIPRGSLWDARAEIEFIANETELMACVLYIEANYLKIRAAAEIRALDIPPAYALQAEKEDRLFYSPYHLLKKHLSSHQFQSANWYANGRKEHNTALTDGTDGIWLTGRLLEYWWNKPVKSYPPNIRKVWFQDGGGILVLTPDAQRQYHENPILDLLDCAPDENGRLLSHLIFAACWQNRSRVWVSGPRVEEEPGATEF